MYELEILCELAIYNFADLEIFPIEPKFPIRHKSVHWPSVRWTNASQAEFARAITPSSNLKLKFSFFIINKIRTSSYNL